MALLWCFRTYLERMTRSLVSVVVWRKGRSDLNTAQGRGKSVGPSPNTGTLLFKSTRAETISEDNKDGVSK